MTKLEDAKQKLKRLKDESPGLRDEIRDLKEWIEYLESIQ